MKYNEMNSAQLCAEKEKLVAHCNKCGHEWSIRADHLLARAYCPICRKTK